MANAGGPAGGRQTDGRDSRRRGEDLPIHSARGLQFRIVLLHWADLLPLPFNASGNGKDRGLLYVAMTRAEEMLVTLHSRNSAYVEELSHARGKA
jgi:superfamily I DNA/RNA helicase